MDFKKLNGTVLVKVFYIFKSIYLEKCQWRFEMIQSDLNNYCFKHVSEKKCNLKDREVVGMLWIKCIDRK